jgi:hypothetical protein
MEKIRIRDPGWEKVGSGIRDKHPGSATLLNEILNEKQILKMLKHLPRIAFFCYYDIDTKVEFLDQVV